MGANLPVLPHEARPGIEPNDPLDNVSVIIGVVPILSTVDLKLLLLNKPHPVRRSVNIFNHRNLTAVVERQTSKTTLECLRINHTTLLSEQIEVCTSNTKR